MVYTTDDIFSGAYSGDIRTKVIIETTRYVVEKMSWLLLWKLLNLCYLSYLLTIHLYLCIQTTHRSKDRKNFLNLDLGDSLETILILLI
jgi:hypothetical protein